ncbi:MAG: chain-length determining protein [Bacteroidaceae bacterium]|nr:chain-length determining protein [Bacteroidaceae bacterium]
MAEDNKYNNFQEEEELEIDLMEYARKLWASRKLLLKVAGIAAIVGVIIALGTPKTYTANVTLAPESGKSGGGGLYGIASMLGVGGLSMSSDADAFNVTLYPDVVSSTPFIIDLLDTKVKQLESENDTTLAGYLKEGTSSSLIGTIVSLPFKAIGAVMSIFSSNDDEEDNNRGINPFQLTKEQDKIVNGLRKLVVANVDKKTGVTSISVTMQDPLVCAIVADTVVTKLQEFITGYRVNKAQEDCKYWEQLHEERKNDYYEKQQNYARYTDGNQGISRESVKIEQARLENEMNLAYQVYSQVATQLQMARAKVQEAKPVFAVVEPATVPLKPSGTSRKMILIGIVFLAVAGASAWILFGQDLWKNLKEGLKEEKTIEKKEED